MAQLNTPVEQAFALSPEDLGALLEPGLEYTGTIRRTVPFCNRSGKIVGEREVCVSGTLPTLAAAMDRPELLRLLLARGHDVNSASQTAVEALLEDCQLRSQFAVAAPQRLSCGVFSANERSSIEVDTLKRLHDKSPFPVLLFQYSGVTPLAAAIVCGSVACVRVLLEQSSVWRTECPAVSVALSLDWRAGDGDYVEACRLVRTLPDGSLRPLALQYIIEQCSENLLRRELAAAPYDTTTIRGAADRLLLNWRLGILGVPRDIQKFDRKLSMLAKRDPAAFQTPILRGRLASTFLCQPENKGLRALVKRFCRDCDIDLGYDQVVLDSVPFEELELGLKWLCAIGRPVLNCDTVLVTGYDQRERTRRLRLLLEHVHFLPGGYCVGLSALTHAVLSSDSLPLLKLALKKGVIPAQEPIKAMLELIPNRPEMRAKLLAEKRPEAPLSLPNWAQTLRRSFPQEYLNRALDAGEPPGPCQVVLLKGAFPFQLEFHRLHLQTPLGKLSSLDPVLFFSMQGGKANVLRSFLSAQPMCYKSAPIYLPKREDGRCVRGGMILTPLCAAALAGQTETVEMLLALGYDANEHDLGSPSLLRVGPNPLPSFHANVACRDVPLSPLLCATLSGNEDTMAALRAHGAVWDMETEHARYALEVLRA